MVALATRPIAAPITPRWYQEEAVKAALDKDGPALINLPTGCHRKGQGILLYDGSIKKVEDIIVGDLLMGPDSTPRMVLQLCRGEEEMYEVKPVKGASFVVNKSHILSLMHTNERSEGSNRVYPSTVGGNIVDVKVSDWLAWSKHKKHVHKLFRVGVEFPKQKQKITIAPYLLGAILGDGTLSIKGMVGFTNIDQPLVDEVERLLVVSGNFLKKSYPNNIAKGFQYRISGRSGKGYIAKSAITLQRNLVKLGLLPIRCEDRFIPEHYKRASRKERLELLAGLIDTDGHYDYCGIYDYVSKSNKLAEDITFLSRSLGFAAYKSEKIIDDVTYYRVCISGDLSVVPTILKRKQASVRLQKKDVLRTGFACIPTGTIEPYYGFSLDGDQRYVLDDFTVTHNTGKSLILYMLCYAPQFLTKRVMILGEHLEILLESRKTILMMDPNADVGVVGFGFAEWDHRILLGGLDTLVIEHRIDKLKTLDIALILVDECFVAGTMIGDTPIENIKPGDIVTAFDEKTQTFSQKKVVRLFKNPVGNRLVKIICDGKETVCTPNHPFYTHSGWKRAEELILEDKLLFFENNLWKKINAIEIYKPGNDGTFGGLCTDGYVYNFEVEDVHTYTANGIVVHNCHHAYTNADEDGNNPDPSQYDKIFTACKEAKLVGVTATVDRADGKDITQVFGPPVYAKGIMEMIEKGYLCSLRNFIVRTTNVLNVQSVNGDYNQTKLEQAVNRKDRNSLIVETCIDQKYGGPDIPTVAFCTGKDHAKALAQEFNSRGIPTAVVTDEVRGKERKQIFADFAIGKIKVICNILVLAEGWDANVWRVVLASPTKSRPRYAQMIGRGTRNYPGKQFCYIVDFTDNTMSHSLDPVHLDDIIGFPVPEGADVREAVKQIKEKQAREGGEEKEEKGVDAAGQKVVAQEINVVNVPWVKDTTGTFRVDIDHSCVVLYPIGNGNYHVVMNMKRSAKSPDNVVPVAKNIPLQWAMGVAEHKVKHLQAKNFSILDPNAPWRREKMTQSQYQTINGLQKSINRPEHYKRIDTSWNKEQAANRIEELIRIKQAMPKAPRAPKKTKKQKAS